MPLMFVQHSDEYSRAVSMQVEYTLILVLIVVPRSDHTRFSNFPNAVLAF